MSFREEAYKLVVDNGYKKIVEVGVWKGQLSRMFYKVADELVLVDPWAVSWNQFPYDVVNGGDTYECKMGEPLKTQKELDRMYEDVKESMPKARVMRMTSTDAARFFGLHYFDLVFLDPIHTYEHCKVDILTWAPRIRPGGMIAGDDYMPEYPCVAKAVDELLPNARKTKVWSCKL